MFDRIGNTRVLGNTLIGKVDLSFSVNGYIFQKRVSFDRVVNIRLGVFIEVYNFCVAAAFEVEYAVVIPAVFVISDQQSLRVGRESRFSGSGKTEEDRGVLTFHIGIGGAVHRGNAFQRQIIIHHGKHAFFHFTAVPGVQNDLLTAGNVEGYAGLGIQSEFCVICNFSFGSSINNEIRFKVSQFFF